MANPRRTTALRRMLVALLVTQLAACSALEPGRERDRAELERYWSSWQLQGSSSYQYVQRRLCYCTLEATLPVLVTVRDGQVTERRFLDPDVPVPILLAAQWGTIEDLFRLIENAIELGAESLQVTYHQRLGYPTHISIDYDARVADDEFVITAMDVIPLSAAVDSRM